jgi:hypothetical protein
MAHDDLSLAERSDEALIELYTGVFDALDDLPMTPAEIAADQGLLAGIDGELASRGRARSRAHGHLLPA